ncbi:MAG: acetyl-CoA carboxylase biotin carboxyl carrier protein [Trueperaceae bacterium]
MDVKEIKKLLDAVAAAEISELTVETGDTRINIRRGPAFEATAVPQATVPTPAPAPGPSAAAPEPTASPTPPAPDDGGTPAPETHLTEVTAPIVGTFYASATPDGEPYVKVGDHVEAGTVLCIIEAMKLMNEIEAETAGTVRDVLVRNEEPVEYGQVLFRIDPD